MSKFISKILQATESHWSLWILAKAAFPAATGGITMWFMELSGLLSEYAPLTYWVAFLVGVLIFLAARGLFFWGKLKATEERIITSLDKPIDQINPLDESFTSKRVKVSDLADPFNKRISRKTFVGCQIVGDPSSAIFLGCHFSDTKYFTACDFLCIPDTVNLSSAPNIPIFENCMFKNCSFYFITIIGSETTGRGISSITNNQILWINKNDKP